MSHIELVLPVGRLVQGSLYDVSKNTKIKDDGTPASDTWFFAVAIPKRGEASWRDTEWGQKIYGVGAAAFPTFVSSPTFAWKIVDGDSTQVTITQTGEHKRPCDYAGFAGCWIVKLSSHLQAPIVTTDGGHRQLLEKNAVKLGDYVEAFISVKGNKSTRKPGVYLNHHIVNFVGVGERIHTTIDPKKVGFKGGVVNTMPAASGFNPASVEQVVNIPPAGTQAVSMPAPHHGILMPQQQPAIPPQQPPQQQRILTPLARGKSYEELKQMGFTDEALIQNGLMLA